MKKQIVYLILCISLSFLLSCEKKDQRGTLSSIQIKKWELFNETHGKCDSLDLNCVKVFIKFPIISYSIAHISDSINSFIHKLILTPPFIHYQVRNPQDIFRQMIMDYQRLQQDYDGYQSSWELYRQVDILYNRRAILSLQYTEYSYTGGAHPIHTHLYYNFNLKTGKRLTFFELCDPQKQDSLLRLTENKFLHQKGLAKKQDLSLAGFWFPENRFQLTENYGLTEKGVIFFYNYYEIAPYAFGTTELFVPGEEAKYFLVDKNLFD